MSLVLCEAQDSIDIANSLVAGVDEVGRGPLAGPVVAAAVILDPLQPITGLNDSKALTEKKTSPGTLWYFRNCYCCFNYSSFS